MNPLRHQIQPEPELSTPKNCITNNLPFPVRLSVTTLSAEIPVPAPCDSKNPEGTTDSPETDGEIIDFWTAWHSHKDYLLRLSMMWMNVSAADAEDAFSDATIRAYEKYAAHAPQISNERAWFARLLHNICIDRHRANKRIRNLYEKVKEISAIDLAAVETRQMTPEGNLLNSELGARLRAAIEELPERLRVPVILRLVQGEDYDDIARKLGISNDNVRKRVQQGRFLLRETLGSLRD